MTRTLTSGRGSESSVAALLLWTTMTTCHGPSDKAVRMEAETLRKSRAATAVSRGRAGHARSVVSDSASKRCNAEIQFGRCAAWLEFADVWALPQVEVDSGLAKTRGLLQILSSVNHRDKTGSGRQSRQIRRVEEFMTAGTREHRQMSIDDQYPELTPIDLVHRTGQLRRLTYSNPCLAITHAGSRSCREAQSPGYSCGTPR